MIAEALALERLADAEKRLLEACDEINRYASALDDANVQCRFWRRAAEHAVDGWNALEDQHELLVDTLRALVREPKESIYPEGDPVAQSMPGYTIVETEKKR